MAPLGVIVLVEWRSLIPLYDASLFTLTDWTMRNYCAEVKDGWRLIKFYVSTRHKLINSTRVRSIAVLSCIGNEDKEVA